MFWLRLQSVMLPAFRLDAMLEAVEDFRGVPHRLEFVRELRGVRWYNDSIATAPERSMAAIRSFDEPIVLLLGGRDKDLPWEELMQLVDERVDHVVLFGEAAEKIQKTVEQPWAAREAFYCCTRGCICMRQSSRLRRSLRPVMSFCCHRAAQVSMSSRILQNVEKGLEHGYKNFRK